MNNKESAACWDAYEAAPEIPPESSDYFVFEQGWNACKSWLLLGHSGIPESEGMIRLEKELTEGRGENNG